jgi:GNAT superfamily N-acetyltransferase
MDIVIKHGSTENDIYQECLDIRYEVLRKPLNMIIKPEEKEQDKQAVHMLATVDGKAAGTVSLLAGRLRQMAVLDGFQGLGLGAKLVIYLEKIASEMGLQEVGLDARFNAIGFYEKLGYECCSEVYEKIGIPHRKMKKVL